jgi:hypothetical protein
MIADFRFMLSKLIFALLALAAVIAVGGCKTQRNIQQDEFLSAFKASEASELRLMNAFDKLREAYANVDAAIERIVDLERRSVARSLFEKNENAWGELIESEVLLRQGAKSATAQPDIRYLRIAEAERASMRVEQLNALAVTIRARFQ